MRIRSQFIASVLAAATVVGGLTASALPGGAATSHVSKSDEVRFLTIPAMKAQRAAHLSSSSNTAGQSTQAAGSVMSAHGGIDGIEVTTGAPKVYVVFYGSQWGTESTDGNGYANFTGDPSGMAPRLQAMLAGLGTDNETWSGVMTQFCDGVANGTTSCSSSAAHVGYPTGGALAGVWYDNSVASISQTTGHTLAAEAVAAAGHFGNTAAAENRSAQYVIVSPTGTHPDGFNTASANWCAWHDYNGDSSLGGGAAASSYGDIAFTNLPYLPDMGASCGANYVNAGTSGALDGVTIVEGHEYAETITDQNPSGGWYDNASGGETGDLCAWKGTGGTGGAQNVTMATGQFPMQATWSNSNAACEISDPIVTDGTGANDFSIGDAPTSGSVGQGSTATTTISTSTTSGSSQSVAFTASGLPTGATATFSSPSVTSGSSTTLSIATTGSTPTGTYPITVTGTATSGTHTVTYTLTVTTPVVNDFSVTPASSTTSIVAGKSATDSIATKTVSGSSQTVALSVSGAPTGTTATLSPTSVTSGSSSTLTIAVGASTTPGTYTLTVTGTATSGTHTATITLTVTAAPKNDFSITLSPTSASVGQGSSASSTASTATTSGSSQTVALSVSGAPTGVTATLGSGSVTSGRSTTLSIKTTAATTPGTYTLTVTGTATSGTHTATYTLTVTAVVPNAFSISLNQSTGTVTPGSSTTATLTTATTSGNAQTVSFSSSGAPSGVTVSFSPSSVTSGGAVTVTFSTTRRVAVGTSTITISAKATSGTQTTTYTLTT